MRGIQSQPFQFTIRTIAIATFWLCTCFSALYAAKSGIVPSVLFVLAIGFLCGAIYAFFKHVPAKDSSRSLKAFVAAIVVWNVLVWLTMLVYPNTIGQLVVATYSALFGDIQASYVVFGRIAAIVGYATITLPATSFSLILVDVLSHRTWSWRRAALSLTIWETAVVFVLVSSYEIGFPYAINQVGWAIFGPPDDIYSFQNLTLHRIIASLLETTPVAWTSLWVHTRIA